MAYFKHHWIRLSRNIIQLYLTERNNTPTLLKKSYNSIAPHYDTYWTAHCNLLSEKLITKLHPKPDDQAIDLACGTGYVTSILAAYTQERPTGVDISTEMIRVATQNYGTSCDFIVSNVIPYLQKLYTNRVDIITCAWGLGYLPTHQVLTEISRVLRPNGKLAIIDNSIITNWELLLFLLLALAEKPQALAHNIKTYYLLNTYTLKNKMKQHGLTPYISWNGSKTFEFSNGTSAVDHWIKSGAAAGFTHIIHEEFRPAIFSRVSTMLDNYYRKKDSIPLTHRYHAVIAYKP